MTSWRNEHGEELLFVSSKVLFFIASLMWTPLSQRYYPCVFLELVIFHDPLLACARISELNFSGSSESFSGFLINKDRKIMRNWARKISNICQIFSLFFLIIYLYTPREINCKNSVITDGFLKLVYKTFS